MHQILVVGPKLVFSYTLAQSLIPFFGKYGECRPWLAGIEGCLRGPGSVKPDSRVLVIEWVIVVRIYSSGCAVPWLFACMNVIDASPLPQYIKYPSSLCVDP